MKNSTERPKLVSEYIFWICLVSYIGVLPVDGTIALRYAAFVGMLLVTLWSITRCHLRLSLPSALPWASYLGIALLSLIWATDAAYSIGQIKTEILYSAIAFAIAASWVTDVSSFVRMAWAIAIFNGFLVSYSIFQVASSQNSGEATIGSFRSEVGTFSTYLVTVAPVLVYLCIRQFEQRKLLPMVLLAILLMANVAAMVFTGNRQGFVAYAVEAVIIAIVGSQMSRIKKTALLAISVAILVAGISAAQHQKSGMFFRDGIKIEAADKELFVKDPRWEIWRGAVLEIAQQPWHGSGFGGESPKANHADLSGTNPVIWHAHNIVLNKGLQLGVPGMIVFITLWVSLAWPFVTALRANRNSERLGAACGLALIAGVFLKSMTDDFLMHGNQLMFLLVCGAMTAALSRQSGIRQT
jgi:hypothetical protein